MRLADFILRHMESILVEWETFAATRKGASHMTPLALRDHAEQILQAIAKDLVTPQTPAAQAEKSMGRAPALFEAPETAAQTHAVLRANSGFDINALASEYRALRSSVLRLWGVACGSNVQDLEDVMRFNEAIDQALAESIHSFNRQVERSRNLMLGMLGHDMRSPLQTIQMTASYLSALNAGDEVSDASARLIKSGARMRALLDDLVDFNRTALGLGISISCQDVDLEAAFSDELEQLRGAHPGRSLQLHVEGDTHGQWDALRLQQLLANLVQNAVKYGDRNSPIHVTVRGASADGDIRFEVANNGPAIQSADLDRLFRPLQRGIHADSDGHDESLGLGLYIAREIAMAHGGDIVASSADSTTVFSVRLPRVPT